MSLYSEEGIEDADTALIAMPLGLFPELRSADFHKLGSAYTQTEIELALFDVNTMKAPGPDGFQALFYRKNWELVAPSLIPTVLNALEGKGFSVGLNDTHIVVIPKVPHPDSITQFRPIGLCNVVYKIIIKVLANRLMKVLPHFISETQSGFVPGWQITDNIVIFQEVIHH